jgi:phosphoserine aminotransferase
MNFLPAGSKADYIHTGVWTKKAMAEAKTQGEVHVAFDGAKDNFAHIPSDDEIEYSEKPAYAYYCVNNTIYGTEWKHVPKVPAGVPLIADPSSDMFSRPIDVDKHALIFAGAQKNLGPAGATLVIIRKDFMETGRKGLPVMLDYRPLAKEQSMLNTPPCFSIYVVGLVFKWILANGGLEGMAKRNEEKAKIVYDAIDNSGGFYRGVARADSRSLMNISFLTPNPELDALFVKEALAHDMSGLKGHRSAGGLRASVYNAFPKKGCEVLAEFMAEFARKNG